MGGGAPASPSGEVWTGEIWAGEIRGGELGGRAYHPTTPPPLGKAHVLCGPGVPSVKAASRDR